MRRTATKQIGSSVNAILPKLILAEPPKNAFSLLILIIKHECFYWLL
jgi:hypothetical protein